MMFLCGWRCKLGAAALVLVIWIVASAGAARAQDFQEAPKPTPVPVADWLWHTELPITIPANPPRSSLFRYPVSSLRGYNAGSSGIRVVSPEYGNEFWGWQHCDNVYGMFNTRLSGATLSPSMHVLTGNHPGARPQPVFGAFTAFNNFVNNGVDDNASYWAFLNGGWATIDGTSPQFTFYNVHFYHDGAFLFLYDGDTIRERYYATSTGGDSFTITANNGVGAINFTNGDGLRLRLTRYGSIGTQMWLFQLRDGVQANTIITQRTLVPIAPSGTSRQGSANFDARFLTSFDKNNNKNNNAIYTFDAMRLTYGSNNGLYDIRNWTKEDSTFKPEGGYRCFGSNRAYAPRTGSGANEFLRIYAGGSVSGVGAPDVTLMQQDTDILANALGGDLGDGAVLDENVFQEGEWNALFTVFGDTLESSGAGVPAPLLAGLMAFGLSIVVAFGVQKAMRQWGLSALAAVLTLWLMAWMTPLPLTAPIIATVALALMLVLQRRPWEVR